MVKKTLPTSNAIYSLSVDVDICALIIRISPFANEHFGSCQHEPSDRQCHCEWHGVFFPSFILHGNIYHICLHQQTKNAGIELHNFL